MSGPKVICTFGERRIIHNDLATYDEPVYVIEKMDGKDGLGVQRWSVIESISRRAFGRKELEDDSLTFSLVRELHRSLESSVVSCRKAGDVVDVRLPGQGVMLKDGAELTVVFDVVRGQLILRGVVPYLQEKHPELARQREDEEIAEIAKAFAQRTLTAGGIPDAAWAVLGRELFDAGVASTAPGARLASGRGAK